MALLFEAKKNCTAFLYECVFPAFSLKAILSRLSEGRPTAAMLWLKW